MPDTEVRRLCPVASGNGTCDDVVVVSDPLSSGVDRDVLATVYVAGKGCWQRVGTRSAARSDQPSELDTKASTDDANFAIDSFAALCRPGQSGTFLVAWHWERVINGFAGYRVFEVGPTAAALRPIDKWTGESAKVYAAFKQTKSPDGLVPFDSDIEAGELRALCGRTTDPNPGVATECSGFKR